MLGRRRRAIVEMLAEAIEVIRLLWEGGYQSHHGRHYKVEEARLYMLPQEAPEIMVAAGKPDAAKLAGTAGDGLIGTAPDADRCRSSTRRAGAGSRASASSPSAGPRTKRAPGRERSNGGRTRPPLETSARSSRFRATSSRSPNS
jgi:alkanesulfonate monooxygenase SsuD/methylene tetrahydromethanopterin reductase-like flavin-dependent oxidoreductase (luciferase family)